MESSHKCAPVRRHVARRSFVRASLCVAFGVLASEAIAYPGDLASCTNLVNLQLPNTTFTLAQYVPPANGIPGYCQVKATVAPQTDVEVRLPDVWYNRYFHQGGSGFDGVVAIPNHASRRAFGEAPLAKGYALVGSNGGHRREQYPNGTFSVDKTLTLNYASGAIADSDMVGKAVVSAYYGQPAKYRYFDGCSNGGKNGSVAMATFGDDYDGVIAGAGVYGHNDEDTGGSDMAGLTAAWARVQQQPALTAGKGATVYNAEIAQCDLVDGVADGIIGNPGACRFDPAVLRCSAGSNDGCLTDAEVQMVNTIRSDLKDASGRVIGAPYGLGDPSTVAGNTAVLANGFLAMAFRAPDYDPTKFELARDFRTVTQVIDGVYGMSGSIDGIARYLKKGKKLILWHGWDDTLVPPYDTLRAFDVIGKAAGSAEKNVRLYMLPGVQHCSGGPGADTMDFLGAITNWVEGGTPPDDSLAAAKIVNGVTTFTRPLCAYPKTWVYSGIGDPRDARNFFCRAPQ